MRYFLALITNLLFINILISNDLSFTNAEIQSYESGTIELLLDNSDSIAGIQFLITDYPNHGDFTLASPTDRLDNFLKSKC